MNCHKQIQNSPDSKQEKLSQKMNFSNLEISIDEASKRLYQKADDTEILSNDEAMFTGMKSDESLKKNQCLVELIPEGEDETSWLMFRSIEALQRANVNYSDIEDDGSLFFDDEGPLGIETGRMFLNGGTASKSKLSEVINTHRVIKKMCQKILTDSSDFILSTVTDTKTFIDFSDPLLPLLKKIVIIEQTHNKGFITYAASTCGFGSSLSIEFSEAEGKSRVFVGQKEKSLDLWYGLMASASLNVLVQLSIKWLSCGFEHMAAVTKDGKVLTWGNGSSGCLGHGNKETLYVPSMIESLYSQKIVYIECGGYHNAAVSEKGEVWVWGRGDVNQLGIDFFHLQKDQIGFVALNPVKIQVLAEEQVFIKTVACGEAHTLLLDSEGKIYSFGWGDDGQLGTDNQDSMSSFTMKNMNIVKSFPYKVLKISAGAIFSACVDEIGQVHIWGNGELGQLGQGQDIKCSSTPIIVSLLNEEFIIDVICGESYVLAMSQNGKVFAWGQGVAGFFKDQDLYPIGSDIICFAPRSVNYVKNTQEYLLKDPNKDSFVVSIADKFKQFIGIGKQHN
jgi:alpha-tubulin suppressor-like RCC1 family protein